METKKTKKQVEPKKLSKLGEWMEKKNRDVWVICDMKAVLR